MYNPVTNAPNDLGNQIHDMNKSNDNNDSNNNNNNKNNNNNRLVGFFGHDFMIVFLFFYVSKKLCM